jgi:REP element-mobilizing transposase RayT
MDLPQRKLQRLTNYNYSQNGAYFLTICTQNRLPLFGAIENDNMILNSAGKMVFEKFFEISEFYQDIIIDKFTVMPNHLHAIMIIDHSGTTQLTLSQSDMLTMSFPTLSLSEYIQRFKTLTTKLYIDGVKSGEYPPFDKKIWQKSYHDHVIRNEQGYKKIWEYIDTNPLKWQEDLYFV